MNRISSATLALCYIMSMSAMNPNTTTIIFSHPQTQATIATWQLSDEQLEQSSMLQDLKNAYPGQTLLVPLPQQFLPAAAHMLELEPLLQPAHGLAISQAVERICNTQGHGATQRLLKISDFLGVQSVTDVGLNAYFGHLLEHLKDHPTHFLDSETPESYGVTILNQELIEQLRRNLVARLPFMTHRQTISGRDAHGKDVCAVAFHPTHNLLASGSRDATIKLWVPDAAGTYNLFQEFRIEDECFNKGVNTLAFHPTQNILASGSDNKMIKLWKANATGRYQPLQTITTRNQGHSDTVQTLVFHPTHELLASASSDHTIKLWVPDETGLYRHHQTIGILDQGHDGIIVMLAFNPTNATLASGSYDKTIKIWTPRANGTYRHYQTIDSHDQGHDGTVNTLAFHPTNGTLASGCWNSTIKVWMPDADSFYQLRQTMIGTQDLGHRSSVYTLAFHPTQSLLASGSRDNSVKLWNILEQPGSSYAQALLIALAYQRKGLPAINISEHSQELGQLYDQLDDATKGALKLMIFKNSNSAKKT